MSAGLIGTAYGLHTAIRYARFGDVQPLLLGHTPMAFSTACVCVVYGLAIFWGGWLSRERTIYRESADVLTAQVLQLALVGISALTAIIVAIIGAVKK